MTLEDMMDEAKKIPDVSRRLSEGEDFFLTDKNGGTLLIDEPLIRIIAQLLGAEADSE